MVWIKDQSDSARLQNVIDRLPKNAQRIFVGSLKLSDSGTIKNVRVLTAINSNLF